MTVTYPVIRLTVGEEILEFSKEEVLSANLIEEFSPISVTLPISKIEFRVISTDESFSMFEGEYFELLSERLPVEVYENIDGSLELMGKFYLSKWKNISEYEFEFTAIDIIGVLDATDYDGNFFEGVALDTVLSDMLDPLDILFTLDESIGGDEISGWIPPGTCREALQQICFAAGANAITARSDRLLIVPTVLSSNIYDFKILESKKFLSQPIELQQTVTSIELVSHNYSVGEDVEDIFDLELEAGSHKIIFEKPFYEIVVVGPGYIPSVLASEGGDYIMTEGNDYIEAGGEYKFGPNTLYLELSEGGNVAITGTPWIDSKSAFTFWETGLTEYANKNVLKIAEATLINLGNAETILNLTRDYYRQRYLNKITLLPSTVKIGDIILTGTVHDKMILATVEKMSTNLVSGHIANVEMLGIQYPGVSLEPAVYSLTGTDVTLTYSEE